MRPELEIAQLIEQYLNGELSAEERMRFEERMKNERELQEEVALQTLVHKVVHTVAEESMRSEIAEGIRKFDSKKRLIKFFVIPAAIAVVITVTLLILKLQPSTLNSSTIEVVPKPVSVKTSPITEQKTAKAREKQKTKLPKASVNNLKPTDTNTPAAKVPESKVVSTEEKKETTPSLPREEEAQNIRNVNEDNPCSLSRLSILPVITGTCPGKEEGTIDFSAENSVFGGLPPYLFSLKGSQEFTTSAVFYNLSAGSYEVRIKDRNSCITNKIIEIPFKQCKVNKFAFNPDLLETWTIPAADGEHYIINISSRSGQLIFKQEGRDGLEWNGYDMYGKPVPAGVYGYIIEFEKGITETGQVSVIR